MIYIVNVSGGLASFEALCRTIACHGVNNTRAIFADTLIEDVDLYRFLDDQERVLGLRIERLADGRTPFDVWIDRRMISRIVRGKRVAPCSLLLKRAVIDRYIAEHYGNAEYTGVFGYTWDEQHRMAAIARNLAPVPCWFPLAEPPYLDKCDIANNARALRIRPPLLYEEGWSHNNCGGGCVWAGQAQWAHLWRIRPETYAQWEDAELRFQRETETLHTILSIRGQNISLRQFRITYLEAQQEMFDPDEFGGCGCFTSGLEEFSNV